MYDHVPRRLPLHKPKSTTPFGNRTGFFKLEKTTDDNGQKRIKVVEHIDLEMGLIFKEDENGRIITDRYAEAESLLVTTNSAKKRCL